MVIPADGDPEGAQEAVESCLGEGGDERVGECAGEGLLCEGSVGVVEAWAKVSFCCDLCLANIEVVRTVEQALPQFEEIHEGQIGARLHEFG